MTGLVTWLEDAGPPEAARTIGPKMGRLAGLAAAGLPVPRGFAVTVEAYRLQAAGSGLLDIADAEFALDPDDTAGVEAASARIRAAYTRAPVAAPVRAALVAAYRELSSRCRRADMPVAVRSSATGEDGLAVSFAGAFDTYLGICGADRVLEAVRACWGSLFAPRAIVHRLRRGISHRDMPMAVGVVELISARSSGVAFSVHPVTGRSDRAVIEASWGWGEAVVMGRVTPDHLEVDKFDRRVLRDDVASKRLVSAFDAEAGRVCEMPMPERLQERHVLDGEEIERIVEALLRVERHCGGPVDVEWVIEGNRRAGGPVTIVQARPVTVPAGEPHGWDPVGYAIRYACGDVF